MFFEVGRESRSVLVPVTGLSVVLTALDWKVASAGFVVDVAILGAVAIRALAGHHWPMGDSQTTKRTRRGYLNPHVVHRVSFWTTTGSLLVAVFSAVLAIWHYTGTDVLWRTVATCAVIGSGTMLFSMVNGLFSDED